MLLMYSLLAAHGAVTLLKAEAVMQYEDSMS